MSPLDETLVGSRRAPQERAFPSDRVGRYSLRGLLGSGGMADVYRAFDTTLNRDVALKFLRDSDHDQIERFMREARAQAHVDHPNICKVYEVGTADGRPFIAMQCIDGMTLAQAAAHMPLDARVAVMADIADALHAAHRVGLVHRDLKPGNIMLEESDGRWQAYVLDFGLARDQKSTNLTTVGVVMGTPSYMAPEQARGERHKIDRRTDVYGLGATLYELLTNRPPFEGDTSIAVVLDLLERDATPPRAIDPSIPADLDTIAMKCLEKDPQRRYDSAHALADDLRRYLNGEPIAARRASPLYKLRTRIRRHKTISALLAVASVAVIASATVAVRTSVRSTEAARAAQRFGQEVERIDAIARYSHMLPLHDVQRDRSMIRDRIALIQRQQKEIGHAAAGPANYAIGRGELALDDYAAARRDLEAAWRGGYQTPEVAYALGRAIGEQYEQELKDLERLTSKDAREARRKAIEREYRDPALAYLRQSSGSRSEASAYAEGLIASYEKNYDVALLRSRAAFARLPWLYEAKRLEADVLVEKGVKAYDTGKYDEALRDYTAAGDAYAVAGSIAPSDGSISLGDSYRWFRTMQIAVNQGGDPRDAMAHGIAAAERAAQTGSRVEESLVRRARMYLRFGEWQLQTGQMPAALDDSIAMGHRAIAINAKNPRAYQNIGAALFSKARWAAMHGHDPFPLYDASIANDQRAVDLEPRNGTSLINLANALRRKAEAQEARGIDGTALVDQAIVYANRAVAVSPDWANIHNDRSLAFLQQGEWQMSQGKDPLPALAEAVRAAERATAINPKLAAAFVNLSNAHYDRADYLRRNGSDPRAESQAGADAALRAVAINPTLVAGHVNAGDAYAIAAQYVASKGGDPRPWVVRASDEARRALAVDPAHASAYQVLAQAFLSQVQSDNDAHRSPDADLAEARDAVAHADQIAPNDSDTLTLAGRIETEAARAANNPSPLLDHARTILERAVAANAKNADAWTALACVYRTRAQWLASKHHRMTADTDAGLNACSHALTINPHNADAVALQAELSRIH